MSYSQNARVRTELIIPPEVEKNLLGEAIETQLQQTIREALTNLRKCSRAGSAQVIYLGPATAEGIIKGTVAEEAVYRFQPAHGGGSLQTASATCSSPVRGLSALRVEEDHHLTFRGLSRIVSALAS